MIFRTIGIRNLTKMDLSARSNERARILDRLEHTAVLIKQSEGDPDGYHSAYFLQEKDGDDVLNSTYLFLPTSTHDSMQLSDLGIQKCAQIFRLFDDDRDSVWSFTEFKAYVTVVRGGFCMYREATESSNSLANDLIRLGMHWLWDGLQRHIQLQRLFDSYDTDKAAAATLHNLGYREDGAECFVYMDFLTKPDITDVELADTVTAMKTLFDVTWLGHLKSLPCFHKLLGTSEWPMNSAQSCRIAVLSPPKTQTHGTTIVRVVVLLTEAMDPFNFLLYLGFPSSLQFDQLVSRLRWTALFNVSANEILTNKRFNPAKHFAVRSVLNVCVGRQACGQIVEVSTMRLL
ncbi:hypothetical protein DYB32_002599 [Aphanomyces invadans]|uniref:EF-hand domain-containing protein n=1 Tax=Aphanomyces invadans TaxID=157072 RepID=A0A418B3G8_9STRA|nr:hypothetical protein DYB32_002599 [Aphanomyces invadans]